MAQGLNAKGKLVYQAQLGRLLEESFTVGVRAATMDEWDMTTAARLAHKNIQPWVWGFVEDGDAREGAQAFDDTGGVGTQDP